MENKIVVGVHSPRGEEKGEIKIINDLENKMIKTRKKLYDFYFGDKQSFEGKETSKNKIPYTISRGFKTEIDFGDTDMEIKLNPYIKVCYKVEEVPDMPRGAIVEEEIYLEDRFPILNSKLINILPEIREELEVDLFTSTSIHKGGQVR